MSDFEPSEVELRRAARERAMELLYESEAKGTDVEAIVDALPLPPDPLTLELVRGVARHRDRIDELLAARVAPRWSLARLAAVDRAILRLAAYELLGAPDRSQALIINEALVLARRFGTDDSPRFVNGVLSAVAAEVRPEAGEEPEADDEVLDLGNGNADGNGRRRLVDAVIIDLDGVIRHWDNEAMPALERELGLPAGAITGAAFDPVRLDRAMRGVLTAEEWYAEIGATVAEAHGVDAERIATAFSEIGWSIDESVVDLVAEVRRLAQVPVVLLSNASTRLLDDLLVSGIASSFDAIVSSADIGSPKPDPKAFMAAVEAAGAEPERCLFVDDTPENVAGARALGLRALQFEDVESLDEELQALGLLPEHTV
ncbi:MAG TPA: transcription antitermination factor NusB [Acidimicrobiales bacterium]